MDKLPILKICFVILFICCIAKQSASQDIEPGLRPELENRRPSGNSIKIVEEYFSNWADKSVAISDKEFLQLDSITKLGYNIYEKLVTDTSLIGIRPKKINASYILLPNYLKVGIADSIRKDMGFAQYHNLEAAKISNFRPRAKFENKKILYYTKEYQESLPKFAENHGVKGFIVINSYLESNYPRYYETSPVIRSIIHIKGSNLYCIEYEIRSCEYQSLLKREGNRWVKIEDITITTSD